MRTSIDIRVRIPVEEILDAVADDIAREVERQLAGPLKQLMDGGRVKPEAVPKVRPQPSDPTIDEAIAAVIAAVSRVEDARFSRDEQPANAALVKAALSLRKAKKSQSKKEIEHV